MYVAGIRWFKLGIMRGAVGGTSFQVEFILIFQCHVSSWFHTKVPPHKNVAGLCLFIRGIIRGPFTGTLFQVVFILIFRGHVGICIYSNWPPYRNVSPPFRLIFFSFLGPP